MRQGRKPAAQKATGPSQLLGQMAIDTPAKRAHTSNDDSPRASSPPKRQMTAVPDSHSIDRDATVAALQSALLALEDKVVGLESNLTEYDTRLRAVESPTGTDSHQPTPAATFNTIHVQQPEPNIQEETSRPESDVAATTSRKFWQVPATDSEKVAHWEALKVFRGISSNREEHNRWKDRKLWTSDSIIYWDEVVWPGLKSAIGRLSYAACQNTQPLDTIDAGTATWVASWAPTFRETLSKNTSDTDYKALFNACLWHLLDEELFSSRAVHKWKEGPWTAIGHLMPTIQPSMIHVDNEVTFSLFAARRHLVRHHYAFHGYHSDPERLESIIRRRLGSMITAPDDNAEQAITRALSGLANVAIKADLHILSSLWDICIEMVDPKTAEGDGFMFDEESPYMESYFPDTHDGYRPRAYRRVAFVAGPLVRVWGDSSGHHGQNYLADFLSGFYGEHYHQESVKCKMKVVLGPYEEPPQEEVPTEATEDAQHTVENTQHAVKNEGEDSIE